MSFLDSTEGIDIQNPDLGNAVLDKYAKIFELLRESSKITRYSEAVSAAAKNEAAEFAALNLSYLQNIPKKLYKGEKFLIPTLGTPVVSQLPGGQFIFSTANVKLKTITYDTSWEFRTPSSIPSNTVYANYPPFLYLTNGTVINPGILDSTGGILYSGKDVFYGHDGTPFVWGTSDSRSFFDWYIGDITSLPEDITTNDTTYWLNMQSNYPSPGTEYYINGAGYGVFAGHNNQIATLMEHWVVDDSTNYDYNSNTMTIIFRYLKDTSNNVSIISSDYLENPTSLFDEGKEKLLIIPLSENYILEWDDTTTYRSMKLPNIFDRRNQGYIVAKNSAGTFENYSGKKAIWNEAIWDVGTSTTEDIHKYATVTEGGILSIDGSSFTLRRNPTLLPVPGDKFIIDTSVADYSSYFSYHDFNKLASYDERWVFYSTIIDADSYALEKVQEYEKKELMALCEDLDILVDLGALSTSERSKTVTFFKSVVDQPAYDSLDHKRIRRYIIDWYSSLRTFVTSSKGLVDPDNLTVEELNEIIVGFGFPFPHDIATRGKKLIFLYNLIDLYKKKGTPEAFVKSLELYGLSEVVLSEWWIHYDPSSDNFFAESKVISPNDIVDENTYVLRKSYENFIELAAPFWQLSEAELRTLFEDSINASSFPSITSYVSLHTSLKTSSGGEGGLTPALSIMQRKLSETIDYYIEYTLVPLLDSTNIKTVNGYLTARRTEPTSDISGINFWLSTDVEKPWIIYDDTGTQYYASDLKKRIVFWDSTDERWEISPLSYIEDNAYIFDESSEIYPNSIATLVFSDISDSTWGIYLSISKDTYMDSTFGGLIYNGYNWINIGTLPPESYVSISNTQMLKKEINRDVTLTDFEGVYSFAEVMLAVAYLFDGSSVSSPHSPDYYYWQYNGEYVPLDSLNFRDDIDELSLKDNKYDPILMEYNQIVDDKDYESGNYSSNVIPYRFDNRQNKFQNEDESAMSDPNGRYYNYDSSKLELRITPRDIKAQKEELLRSKFQYIADGEWTQGVYAQLYPEEYLKVLNPDFKTKLDDLAEINSSLTLENILLDLEYYMRFIMGISDAFFSYAIIGGEFYTRSLRPVIDFFKPFRVNLLDFNAIFEIKDSVSDAIVPDDNLNMSIIHTIIDDKITSDRKRIFGEAGGPLTDRDLLIRSFKFDETFKDTLETTINHTINEHTTGIYPLPFYDMSDTTSGHERLSSDLDSLRMEENVQSDTSYYFEGYPLFDFFIAYCDSCSIDYRAFITTDDSMIDAPKLFMMDYLMKRDEYFDLSQYRGVEKKSLIESYLTNRLALCRRTGIDDITSEAYSLRKWTPVDNSGVELDLSIYGRMITGIGDNSTFEYWLTPQGYTIQETDGDIDLYNYEFFKSDGKITGNYDISCLTNIEIWEDVTSTPGLGIDIYADCSAYALAVFEDKLP